MCVCNFACACRQAKIEMMYVITESFLFNYQFKSENRYTAAACSYI